MFKIIHIITDLNMGGSEKMLYNVVAGSDKSLFEHTVISMMDMGFYGTRLEDLGIKVHCLNMRRGVPKIGAVLIGRRICKNTDIIQTWMYHADFFGMIVKLLLPKKKLIWGIRQSDINPKKDTRSTIIAAFVNSKLSWVPNAIVCNSKAGIENHVRFGFRRNKMRYIPNGIDTDIFYKRQANKETLNKQNKLFTICTVGRWDIQKGYSYLMAALSKVKKTRNDFKLVICGHQLSEDNSVLMKDIQEQGVSESVQLLGPSTEVYNVLSQADLFILPSIGEGFSNALGEAMACELPCIVTDVGDSAKVLGDCGWVVPPGNSDAIADAITSVLKMDREKLRTMGASARSRIVQLFGIQKSIELYENLYKEMVEENNNKGGDY